jgi:very-long-chain ceramide synthase
MLLLAVLQFPIQAASRSHFERALPVSKFPKGSKERRVKVQMMAERMYRLFLYLAFTLLGLWILKQGNFLHRYLLGSESNPQYFTNYPCQVLPRYLDDFYVIKFSYHIFEIINASLFHRDRRDFSEFLLHHIVTIVLVGYSYGTNVIPIGGAIMLVMDASDVLVAVFKLTVDAYDHLQFPAFLMMVAGWVYFRLWFYPVYLISEIWT